MRLATDRFVTGRRAKGFARGRCRPGIPCALETLESRTLMTFSWSPQEVYLSELLNRARANPAAEGARLGLDLSAGLTGAEAARLVAQEPLALNQFLTAAARAHSLDMGARNFFDHTNPDNQDPTDRVQAAGYAGTAGENIAGAYTDLDLVHRAWLQSVGHRKNALSLHDNFDATFHYSELGVGVAFNAGGAYNNYFTEVFGAQSGTPSVFLLGVAFDDADSNDFYGIGEGAGGIRVDVALQSTPNATVATYTTDAAGNYQLAVAPGAYYVTFTRVSDGLRVRKSATLGSQNLAVSAETGELALPPDDYADAGEWSGASVIELDPALGNGAKTGALESAGDNDLFRFVATRSGQTTITLTHPTGQFAMQLAAFNASTAQVATGIAGGEFGNGSVVTFTVTQGQTYYLLARASASTSLGQYIILIQGPIAQGTQDDFADIGDLANAAAVQLDAGTGNGSKVGYLESAGDTDLFRLVTPREGSMNITLLQPAGTFGMLLRVFDSSGVQVAMGAAGGEFGNASVITFTTTIGQVHFLSAEPTNGSSLGVYLLQVIGPGPAPEPPPPIIINDGHKPAYQSLVTTLLVNGRLSLVYTNWWGQPIVATPNDNGTWTWGDLRGGVETNPEVDGEMVAWNDRRERVNYFAVRGLDGLILFREDAPGRWSHRNLSEEIDLSLLVSADLELFFDHMGRASIAGFSDGGDLIIYSQMLTRNSGGQYIWTFRNVTALDVEPKRLTMPEVNSELVSWVTPNKSANLAFLDDTGTIQLFYKQKGKVRWSLQNLGVIARTGELLGELNVVQTARNGVTITGTDVDGHIWATTYRENAAKVGWWSSRDLTARLRSHSVSIRSHTSYVDRSGFAYIAGIKSDGTIGMFRYNPSRNAWRAMSTELNPPDFRNMEGRLSASVSSTGEINIVGTLDSFRLVRWTMRPGQAWTFEDVTYKLASTPPN